MNELLKIVEDFFSSGLGVFLFDLQQTLQKPSWDYLHLLENIIEFG